jgi:hypothetical protein
MVAATTSALIKVDSLIEVSVANSHCGLRVKYLCRTLKVFGLTATSLDAARGPEH